MADGVITGTVNWFSVTKGYGFITRSDGGEDVFVHQSDLLAEGFRSLHEGEAVEFKMGSTDAGRPKAVSVTGPGGAAVKGVPKRGSGGPRGEGQGRGRGRDGAAKERPAGSAGGGRTRGPRPPREEPQGESSGLQVVVLNLPWTATTEALKEFMAPAGTIEHVEVAADASGRARGYGVVKYATKEEAAKAVESVHGKPFEDRPVTVKLDRYG